MVVNRYTSKYHSSEWRGKFMIDGQNLLSLISTEWVLQHMGQWTKYAACHKRKMEEMYNVFEQKMTRRTNKQSDGIYL